MQLKRIEIQGFKSFADKTIIEFENGITTIVGPNGSGKSNISDAVRWVLGEQSAKSLRGSKMEDIIFAGTQQRKMLGFAEVSLVLDNTDGALPIDFAEVTVTRRVYRSGESEYLINKSSCRLKDVQELFMDTGIGKDSYSIIGQGKIEEIISSKSEERRNIFEEASGIVKYRTRRDEALRKLENTNSNLERVNDILREIDNNLGPLEEKSVVAKTYLELKAKLKDIEVKLFLNVIDNTEDELKVLEEKCLAIEESIKQKEDEVTTDQRVSDDNRVSLEELLIEIEKKQEEYYSSLSEVDKLVSRVEAFDDRVKLSQENIQTLKGEIVGNETSISLLYEEISTRTNKKDNLKLNKERFETELEEKDIELKKVMENMGEKEAQIEQVKLQIEEYKEKTNEIKLKIVESETKIENDNKRILNIEKESKGHISVSDDMILTENELKGEFETIASKKNSLQRKLEKSQFEKEDLDKFFATYTEKENEYKQSILETRSKLNYMTNLENESEGYARSVKSILDLSKRNSTYSSHVYGTLASLVSTDEKYEKAIEISMGGYLQNIVVDADKCAKELVQFLKDGMLGRATFLPIESIRLYKDEIQSNLKDKSGYIGTAMELVKFDKKYEAAIRLALGRTVIVDTIENGIKISKISKGNCKIVTLAGEIIASTGSITGGQVAGKQMTLIGRSRKLNEYKARLEKLEADYTKHLAGLSGEKSRYESLINQIAEYTDEYSQISTKYSVMEERLNATIRENVKLKELRKNKEQEKELLLTEIEDLKTDINEYNKKLDDIKRELDIRQEEINEYARFNKEREEYVSGLKEDVMNLRISLSSFDESEFAIDEMVEKIKQDIDNFENSNIRKKELIIEHEKELENSDAKNEQDKEGIQLLKQRAQEIMICIEELKDNKQKNIVKQGELEKQIFNSMKLLEKLKDEKNKTESKKFKYDSDIGIFKDKMWEEYELTISSAREHNKSLDAYNNISKTKLDQEANKYKNEIKNLGDVSVSSIEEYKELKNRSEFISNQKNDLEETKSKLENLIDNTTSVMKSQFAKQFKIINENFKEVFLELFGGGKAELKLTDEKNVLESGIEIEAQPPGKKLQSMSLLSGGEKALTAIAILFAILKIKSPPFCVLDEIEAALDDINVTRFASYIKNYSAKTQFILITHRKGTMEIAGSVYGVTMQEYGVSKLISMKMK